MKDESTSAYPRLELGPEDFKEEMEDWACSEEQKLELLGIIWNVCRICVDLHLDVSVIPALIPGVFEKDSQDSNDLLEVIESAVKETDDRKQ